MFQKLKISSVNCSWRMHTILRLVRKLLCRKVCAFLFLFHYSSRLCKCYLYFILFLYLGHPFFGHLAVFLVFDLYLNGKFESAHSKNFYRYMGHKCLKIWFPKDVIFASSKYWRIKEDYSVTVDLLLFLTLPSIWFLLMDPFSAEN